MSLKGEARASFLECQKMQVKRLAKDMFKPQQCIYIFLGTFCLLKKNERMAFCMWILNMGFPVEKFCLSNLSFPSIYQSSIYLNKRTGTGTKRHFPILQESEIKLVITAEVNIKRILAK